MQVVVVAAAGLPGETEAVRGMVVLVVLVVVELVATEVALL